MKPQNHTRIIEWAERNVKEHVETIKFYQSEGMDLLKAYHITMQNTVIGEGYKAQVLVEVGITPAQYTAYLLNKGGK